jgi:hypothetical protein
MRICHAVAIAIALGLVAASSSRVAMAVTSITNKASGSAFTMDFALDSVTGNIRQMMTLFDPTTGLLVPPFQAGNSIGNTSFGISGMLPAFAATPTFNLGTLNGAATAANQTNAAQKTQIVDGFGNVIASSTNNALTTGQQGMAQMTANRALFVNPRNASGTEIGTSANPFRNDPTGSTTQPISGTVIANAGTNLNTSLLATVAKQPALGTAGTPSAGDSGAGARFAAEGLGIAFWGIKGAVGHAEATCARFCRSWSSRRSFLDTPLVTAQPPSAAAG